MELQKGQRVSYTHQPDWGIRLVGDNAKGTVIAVSERLARIKFDTGEAFVFDRLEDPRLTLVDQIVLDLSDWTRLREVDEYAKRYHHTRAEAIMHLVNQGLSHEREPLI